MKKIILFTRLDNENEWNAWVQIFGEKGINPQNNELSYSPPNREFQLIVKNGKTKLGTLPVFNEIENEQQENNEAKEFIKKLNTEIQTTKEGDIIAIHFGGGGTLEERLEPWLERLSQCKDAKAAANNILENFNKPGKPILKEYSIGATDIKNIKDWIENKTDKLENLNKLYMYLMKHYNPQISRIKHQIVNLLEPLRVDIEGLIEKNFDKNYWEQVVSYWKDKDKISNVFNQVRQLLYYTNERKGKLDSLQDIIEESSQQNNKNWKEINKLLPRNGNLTGDENVNNLLLALMGGNKIKFQQICKFHGNVYKKWMDELIGAIEQIILEVQTKE